MSRSAFTHSYGLAQFVGKSASFECLIFAAFRLADEVQAELLRHSFPVLWEEFVNRMNDPTNQGFTRGEVQRLLLNNPDDPSVRDLAEHFGIVLP